MAKVSAVLWTHKRDAEGRHPIWLRFNDARSSLYLSLQVAIAPRHWNPNDARRPVRKSHPHADEINGLIAARLAAAESERLRLLTAGLPDTAAALKAALVAKPQDPDPDFLAYVEAFLVGVEAAGNVARVDRERAVLSKLRAWRARVPIGAALRRLPAAAQAAAEKKAAAVRLPFSQLTPALLRDFEAYLVAAPPAGLGNKKSTVEVNANMIRLHVRRAIREGLISRDADPFLNYSPPRAVRTERTRLTLAQIAAVEALDLGPRGPSGSLDARVRDAFLFALYATGVRFGDLARLRVRDVQTTEATPASNGAAGRGPVLRLAYIAGKTGKLTSTLLVAQAVRIVLPYLVTADGTPRDGNDYLFPILVSATGRSAYDLSTPRGMDRAIASQNALHNKALKRIGAAAGIDAKGSGLSMHVARHSFADLARRGGWSVYDVKQALRHSSVVVTERYIAGFDSEALDAQTRALFGDDPSAPAVDGGSDVELPAHSGDDRG